MLRSSWHQNFTGSKTPSEYIFSELPQIGDIARSAFSPLTRPLVLQIWRSGSERFPAELWPNNFRELSRIDWRCSANGA
jgi:hypothetical protein